MLQQIMCSGWMMGSANPILVLGLDGCWDGQVHSSPCPHHQRELSITALASLPNVVSSKR